MAIIVTPLENLFSGYAILSTANQMLQIYNPYNRKISFTMVIDKPFPEALLSSDVALTDSGTTIETELYPLVDRLNKPIQSIELFRYAGRRRCLQCVFDPVYKVIRVCSCIDPIVLELPEPNSQATKPQGDKEKKK